MKGSVQPNKGMMAEVGGALAANLDVQVEARGSDLEDKEQEGPGDLRLCGCRLGAG